METELVKYEDLKRLANERINEAKILLPQRLYSGSYYLAGYAVELALKAYYCNQKFFPPKKTDSLYEHNLNKLLAACGLKEVYDNDVKTNTQLHANWMIVSQWNSESRYKFFDKAKAESLIEAITNQGSGILLWIQTKW